MKRFGIALAIVVGSSPAIVLRSEVQSRIAALAEHEAFLQRASLVSDPPADARKNFRVTLADTARKHDASVETVDGTDPTRRHYKMNVAAYELDKLLGLNLVLPTVERVVAGRPAALTWWVDEFAMNELDRRRKGVQPPDADSWERQVHAARVFDELIANTYRDPSPGLYLNSVWDNLLITTGWTVWLTDHTAGFRTRVQLQDPESLTRCPRTVLDRLRTLNRERLQQALGRYLSVQQLDSLDRRRELLTTHFDEQISRNGAAAVLYDLPARPSP